jgi:pimeloyl-ACP methyl ester carboxylesterase
MRYWLIVLAVSLALTDVLAQADFPPPGDIYTVNGREMHLNCTGEGSPTVILEAGIGGTSLNWSVVQPAVAEFTRVCSYDRPGYGWSAPLNRDFSVPAATDDLHRLLFAAGVAPPYVMVGHSFGGVLLRDYTRQYPDAVMGVVLVDAVHPQMPQRITFYPQALELQIAALRLASGAARLGYLQTGDSSLPAPENIPPDVADAYTAKLLEEKFFDTTATEALYMAEQMPALTLPDTLGDMPLFVISHGIPERNSFLGAPLNAELAAEAEATWQQLQIELATLAPQGERIVATESGHNIQFEQPDLVINAVREIVTAGR